MTFTPPTAEAVSLQAQKIGLPEIEAQKFHNYYESVGWTVGRKKMVSWLHAITGWKLRWQEGAQRRSQISPSAQAILWQKELDRAEEQIRIIRAGYSENLSMSPEDRKRITALKERRTELMKNLNMSV